MDKLTSKLVHLLLVIAKAGNENNKEYFIGGGFAIDLTVGKITRKHHDIDFHPMLEDFPWWRDWFLNQGLDVKKKPESDFPDVYHVFDKKGIFMVDMWPFRLVSDQLMINKEGVEVDANRHWSETRIVNFQNTKVRIENPKRVLEQKMRHAKDKANLRPEDKHDFKLLSSTQSDQSSD